MSLKKNCLINAKYIAKNLVCKAMVKSENDTKSYVDSIVLSPKNCYTKNKDSFKHKKHTWKCYNYTTVNKEAR